MKDSQDDINGNNCFSKLFYPCTNFISFLNIGQIHPLEPIATANSEYVTVDHDKKIRVIHVKPKSNVIRERSIKLEKRLSRASLSEEYWFTQWSKPLRNNPCNCSFRRSARFSKLSDEFGISLSRRGTASFTTGKRKSKVSNKVVNIETFVENLVQDTFLEAFREYCQTKKTKTFDEVDNVKEILPLNGGMINLGFIPIEDDIIDENEVQLRTKVEEPRVQLYDENSFGGIRASKRKICTHGLQSGKMKPLVMLLHGIGSSADVWWNIINSLQNRGYEVIAPDMLGHGFSSVPNHSKDYLFKNLLSILLAIFETYLPISDQKRKCIIIGHSFGCSLATALYKYKAQQIAQMVLISGGGPTPLVAPAEDELAMVTCLQTVFKPLLFCGMKRSLFYSSRGKYFVSCEENSSIPEYVLRYICNGQNWPEGDAAYHRRIMVPTLLVHGLQDKNITLVQECEMERTIPRSFLELIPNAGHIAMLETPEQLSHMILCFVEWWSY